VSLALTFLSSIVFFLELKTTTETALAVSVSLCLPILIGQLCAFLVLTRIKSLTNKSLQICTSIAGGALVIAILSVRQLTDWGKLTGMIWLGVIVFAVYFAYYFAYSSLDLRILRTYRARKLEKKH
jgi:hypothetical protein